MHIVVRIISHPTKNRAASGELRKPHSRPATIPIPIHHCAAPEYTKQKQAFIDGSMIFAQR
jgi:hypothetical protein